MTSTILLDSDSIKGYSVWIASVDALDFSYIYARLYRKIMESEDAAEIQKYNFSSGLNVPYDNIDTLIIVDECIPVAGIPARVKIIPMTRLEAKGHIGSYPQLAETDFKVIKLIERVMRNSPESFGLTKEEQKLLLDREAYRQELSGYVYN